MRKFYKALATLILIPTIGFIFLMGKISLIEGRNLFAPYIDTEFAPDYTPEKFSLITYDYSLDSVTSLIGNPIHKYQATIDGQIQIRYNYTNDANLRKQNKNRNLMNKDFAWYRSSIRFNAHGKIIDINKGWSYD